MWTKSRVSSSRDGPYVFEPEVAYIPISSEDASDATKSWIAVYPRKNQRNGDHERLVSRSQLASMIMGALETEMFRCVSIQHSLVLLQMIGR